MGGLQRIGLHPHPRSSRRVNIIFTFWSRTPHISFVVYFSASFLFLSLMFYPIFFFPISSITLFVCIILAIFFVDFVQAQTSSFLFLPTSADLIFWAVQPTH